MEAAWMDAYLSLKEAPQLLGISAVTLRSYERKSDITHVGSALRRVELSKWPAGEQHA